MITIREETLADVDAREALLDRAFGPARFEKTCERLREGRMPAHGLAFIAVQGRKVVGTVRMWHVAAGPGRPALVLGPLAVDARFRSLGIGAMLTRHALARATELGHAAVLLVGDAPYYERFGFRRELTDGLRMPGPVERERFLGLELIAGALEGASGLLSPTGARAPVVDLPTLVAADAAEIAALRAA